MIIIKNALKNIFALSDMGVKMYKTGTKCTWIWVPQLEEIGKYIKFKSSGMATEGLQ